MSVSLNPSSSLGFPRPLTQLVKRNLTITNPNGAPVAFKVKTTAPKLYCVRPNSGRIEPGQSVDVAVMLQAMKEEPPIAAKCKDKFLIQSTVITPEKESLPLADIWGGAEGGEDAKVHQQKLKVTYLPPEGQTVIEEDEGQANQSSMFENGDSQHYDTVRSHPLSNGHSEMPRFDPVDEEPLAPGLGAPAQVAPEPPASPNAHHEFAPAHEEPQHTDVEEDRGAPPMIAPIPVAPPVLESHNIPPAPAPAAAPAVVPAPAPAPKTLPAPPAPIPAVVEPLPKEDLQSKLVDAQAEIQRLRALLAAAPSPAAPVGLRQRNKALSDDGDSTYAGSEVTTTTAYQTDGPVDGVPLQVVAIIALGVFITTYLFF